MFDPRSNQAIAGDPRNSGIGNSFRSEETLAPLAIAPQAEAPTSSRKGATSYGGVPVIVIEEGEYDALDPAYDKPGRIYEIREEASAQVYVPPAFQSLAQEFPAIASPIGSPEMAKLYQNALTVIQNGSQEATRVNFELRDLGYRAGLNSTANLMKIVDPLKHQIGYANHFAQAIEARKAMVGGWNTKANAASYAAYGAAARQEEMQANAVLTARESLKEHVLAVQNQTRELGLPDWAHSVLEFAADSAEAVGDKAREAYEWAKGEAGDLKKELDTSMWWILPLIALAAFVKLK